MDKMRFFEINEIIKTPKKILYIKGKDLGKKLKLQD